MDFREIIKDAAKRKLLDLAKVYLDIIDELKKEEVAILDKFTEIANAKGLGEDFIRMRPFLCLIDDNKKDIIRKRILDKTNELIRELES